MPLFTYVRNLDRQGLKNLIKTLIYIQFVCSLLGFVDVSHNHLPLINLGIAFFGLGAFASNSQALTRAYAVLLSCAILLDMSWFVHCWYHIRSMWRERNEMWLFISSLAMEIVGFCLRLFSSLVMIRMYRLGSVPRVDGATTSASQEDRADEILRRLLHRTDSYSSSNDDPDAVVGEITSEDTNLFYPDQQDNVHSLLGHNDGIHGDESASSAEIDEVRSSPVADDGVDRNESASSDDSDDGPGDSDQQHNANPPINESASSAETHG